LGLHLFDAWLFKLRTSGCIPIVDVPSLYIFHKFHTVLVCRSRCPSSLSSQPSVTRPPPWCPPPESFPRTCLLAAPRFASPLWLRVLPTATYFFNPHRPSPRAVPRSAPLPLGRSPSPPPVDVGHPFCPFIPPEIFPVSKDGEVFSVFWLPSFSLLSARFLCPLLHSGPPHPRQTLCFFCKSECSVFSWPC